MGGSQGVQEMPRRCECGRWLWARRRLGLGSAWAMECSSSFDGRLPVVIGRRRIAIGCASSPGHCSRALARNLKATSLACVYYAAAGPAMDPVLRRTAPNR